MGASRSRKPGRRRAWRSCKPPRGGAGVPGLPRGRVNSYAADLPSPLREGRGHLCCKAKVAWGDRSRVACGRGRCSPRSPCNPACHQGAALMHLLWSALQLEEVAGSRRRRGGDGHRAQFGGRHRGPWFRPRCWGRLGEGRRGPSSGGGNFCTSSGLLRSRRMVVGSRRRWGWVGTQRNF